MRPGQPYRDHQLPVLTDPQRERLIVHHVRWLGKLGVRVHSHRSPRTPNTSPSTPPKKRGRPRKTTTSEANPISS